MRNADAITSRLAVLEVVLARLKSKGTKSPGSKVAPSLFGHEP